MNIQYSKKVINIDENTLYITSDIKSKENNEPINAMEYISVNIKINLHLVDLLVFVSLTLFAVFSGDSNSNISSRNNTISSKIGSIGTYLLIKYKNTLKLIVKLYY